MEGAIPRGELIRFALHVNFQQSYPSLFFSPASFTGSSWAIPGTFLSVAFPGYQHMSQRMGHHKPLCFPQPHSRHTMHWHSSICCWPKERPLLKLATHAVGSGHPSAPATRGKRLLSPQREQYYNCTDISLSLRHSILVFDSLLPEGSHLKLSWKSWARGLPSDPDLHHSLR